MPPTPESPDTESPAEIIRNALHDLRVLEGNIQARPTDTDGQLSFWHDGGLDQFIEIVVRVNAEARGIIEDAAASPFLATQAACSAARAWIQWTNAGTGGQNGVPRAIQLASKLLAALDPSMTATAGPNRRRGNWVTTPWRNAYRDIVDKKMPRREATLKIAGQAAVLLIGKFTVDGIRWLFSGPREASAPPAKGAAAGGPPALSPEEEERKKQAAEKASIARMPGWLNKDDDGDMQWWKNLSPEQQKAWEDPVFAKKAGKKMVAAKEAASATVEDNVWKFKDDLVLNAAFNMLPPLISKIATHLHTPIHKFLGAPKIQDADIAHSTDIVHLQNLQTQLEDFLGKVETINAGIRYTDTGIVISANVIFLIQDVYDLCTTEFNVGGLSESAGSIASMAMTWVFYKLRSSNKGLSYIEVEPWVAGMLKKLHGQLTALETRIAAYQATRLGEQAKRSAAP